MSLSRILFLGMLSTTFLTQSTLCQLNIDLDSYEDVLKKSEGSAPFIMIGEAHEVAGTYELETFIIEQKLKEGYTTIIYEGGISEAALINIYLTTGDETVLDYTRASGPHYRNYLRALYDLDSDIRYKGVDFERAVCLEFLFEKWFEGVRDARLDGIINQLSSISKKTSAKKLKQILLEVRSRYADYEVGLEQSLGTRAKTLKGIIFNPVFQADFGISSKKRDQAILENLLNIPTNDLSKSILIFGSNHFTNKNYFWNAFSKQKDENLTCHLLLFAYKNCSNFIKKKRYSSAKPLSEFIKDGGQTKPSITFKIVEPEHLGFTNRKLDLIIAEIINQ